MPSTTACPYLPGQTVNTLTVPSQQNLRQRSASLTSMRITDYQAIDPEAKYISPRPVPQPPTDAAAVRKRSAPGLLRHAASSRSLSPSPAWRRLFGHSKNDERGRSRDRERDDRSVTSASTYDDNRSATSSRSRNRSMSPESLRRFLSEDIPSRPGSNLSERPALVIPEDIAEENEDDDNFATSAISESQPYLTSLSPPPFQRSTSSETAPLTIKNLSSLTLTTERPTSKPQPAISQSLASEGQSISQLHSSNLTSATSSAMASPLTASTPEDEVMTFYDDSTNDDEDIRSNNSDMLPIQGAPALRSRFTGYSLPRLSEDSGRKSPHRPTFGASNAPQLVNPAVAGSYPSTGASFLPTPVDTGVDDFVSEMGWMVDSIATKAQ